VAYRGRASRSRRRLRLDGGNHDERGADGARLPIFVIGPRRFPSRRLEPAAAAVHPRRYRSAAIAMQQKLPVGLTVIHCRKSATARLPFIGDPIGGEACGQAVEEQGICARQRRRRLFLLSFRRTSSVHQKALALRRLAHYALCSIGT
jgi:hypothetical protein